eukprot:6202968-Amphidinium_carterae.5
MFKPVTLGSKGVKVSPTPRQSASGISVSVSVRAVINPTCNLRPGPLVVNATGRHPHLLLSNQSAFLGGHCGNNAKPLPLSRP